MDNPDRQHSDRASASIRDLVLVGWMALALVVWAMVSLGPLLTGKSLEAPPAAGYLWLALVASGILGGALCLLRNLGRRD